MLNLIKDRQYWFILLVQAFLFFSTPFIRGRPLLYWLSILGLFGIFGAVILRVWKARLPRLLAIASALVALVTGFMAFPSMQFEEPVVAYLSACGAAYALFILIAIVSIGVDVLFRERVTVDCILGGICVYMLLGMFFAFVFGLFAIILPGSFDWGIKGGSPAGAQTLSDILYFSYSTLTTTGYGDITPAHPFVRMVATSESIVGTLYIAIMISRLVGLHVAEKGAAGLEAPVDHDPVPSEGMRRNLTSQEGRKP